MKRIAIALATAGFAFALGTNAAAQGRHDEKPHGYDAQKAGVAAANQDAAQSLAAASEGAQQIIELKDGGTLIVRKDGSMYHANASGARVKMRDGIVMEAKDGTRYMMRNDRLWRQVTEKAASPGHP